MNFPRRAFLRTFLKTLPAAGLLAADFVPALSREATCYTVQATPACGAATGVHRAPGVCGTREFVGARFVRCDQPLEPRDAPTLARLRTVGVAEQQSGRI